MGFQSDLWHREPPCSKCLCDVRVIRGIGRSDYPRLGVKFSKIDLATASPSGLQAGHDDQSVPPGLERLRVALLRPLLFLQFLLLAGLFALCGAAALPLNPDAGNALVGCQLGVAAMGVQTALVQLALKGAPATAVMTTNITRFIMDLGDAFLGREPGDVTQARWRAKHTWPVIAGFTAGAALGAACFAAVGLKALALPVALSLLALAMGLGVKHDVTN